MEFRNFFLLSLTFIPGALILGLIVIGLSLSTDNYYVLLFGFGIVLIASILTVPLMEFLFRAYFPEVYLSKPSPLTGLKDRGKK